MGYFSMCSDPTNKEALLNNIEQNTKLWLQAPDCDYLLAFLKTDIAYLKELLEDQGKTSGDPERSPLE